MYMYSAKRFSSTSHLFITAACAASVVTIGCISPADERAEPAATTSADRSTCSIISAAGIRVIDGSSFSPIIKNTHGYAPIIYDDNDVKCEASSDPDVMRCGDETMVYLERDCLNPVPSDGPTGQVKLCLVGFQSPDSADYADADEPHRVQITWNVEGRDKTWTTLGAFSPREVTHHFFQDHVDHLIETTDFRVKPGQTVLNEDAPCIKFMHDISKEVKVTAACKIAIGANSGFAPASIKEHTGADVYINTTQSHGALEIIEFGYDCGPWRLGFHFSME